MKCYFFSKKWKKSRFFVEFGSFVHCDVKVLLMWIRSWITKRDDIFCFAQPYYRVAFCAIGTPYIFFG